MIPTRAAYLHDARELFIGFSGGAGLTVPLGLLPEVALLDPIERRTVRVSGDRLEWPGAGCLVPVPGLLFTLFGPVILRERQRLLGSRTSAAKAAAARANGSRPKKRRKAQ